MGILSIVGGVISILVAAWNVYIKVVERREDKIAKRPYVVIEALEVASVIPEGASMADIHKTFNALDSPIPEGSAQVVALRLVLKNSGVRPTRNLSVTIKMRCSGDPTLSLVPILSFSPANVLPGGMSVPQEVKWAVPSNLSDQLVKVTVSYVDAVLDKPCPPMSFYYRWGGTDDGVISSVIAPLSARERDLLEKYLSDPTLISPTKVPASLMQ